MFRPVEAPWRVTAYGDATYMVEEHTHSEVIAGVNDEYWDTHTGATVRLICAAPDMLKALEEADDVLTKLGCDLTAQKCRAAIAKALLGGEHVSARQTD